MAAEVRLTIEVGSTEGQTFIRHLAFRSVITENPMDGPIQIIETRTLLTEMIEQAHDDVQEQLHRMESGAAKIEGQPPVERAPWDPK